MELVGLVLTIQNGIKVLKIKVFDKIIKSRRVKKNKIAQDRRKIFAIALLTNCKIIK